MANCYTMGSSFFYGSVFGGTIQRVEEVLGPASRRGCRRGLVRGRRRTISAPAVQLHAPAKPLTGRRNDPMSLRAAVRGGGLAGFGAAHPYPGMAAAAAMTFLNNLGAPLPTPANLAALSGLARVLHEFGCRARPWARRPDAAAARRAQGVAPCPWHQRAMGEPRVDAENRAGVAAVDGGGRARGGPRPVGRGEDARVLHPSPHAGAR